MRESRRERGDETKKRYPHSSHFSSLAKLLVSSRSQGIPFAPCRGGRSQAPAPLLPSGSGRGSRLSASRIEPKPSVPYRPPAFYGEVSTSTVTFYVTGALFSLYVETALHNARRCRIKVGSSPNGGTRNGSPCGSIVRYLHTHTLLSPHNPPREGGANGWDPTPSQHRRMRKEHTRMCFFLGGG